MCGIVGIAEGSGIVEIARAMADRATHRGPDDWATWESPDCPVAFAHRRLSIVDLSELGRQPMHSVSGRYTICFNGEVYNYQELRRELVGQGVAFRGTSDTEVMLAAIEAYGVREATQRFNGMFAFGLWDSRERVLHLVRDRCGVKPLHFGWVGGHFVFCSELKSLYAVPRAALQIDRRAVAQSLRFGYVPAPATVFSAVYKLIPGTILSLPASAFRAAPVSFSPWADRPGISPRYYWRLDEVVRRGREHPFHGNELDAIEELDHLVRDSVKMRMIADVPLGAFLSGGIDSSLVVAAMQAQSNAPVQSFSIGFSEASYNEAHYAEAVARHLGTNHTQLYVSPAEAIGVIPSLAAMYDEPFADSSQIPTYLVAKLARQRVTVSLSGDGGDELFCGYVRYPWGNTIWRSLSLLPGFSRHMLAQALRGFSASAWDGLFSVLNPTLPQALKITNPGERVHRIAAVIGSTDRHQLYKRLVSHWEPAEVMAGDAAEGVSLFDELAAQVHGKRSFIDEMMYLDTRTYLPDDIMTKVDRATMAVSLEAREPLLDYRIVEFAWRIPHELKLRGGESKWILRRVLDRYVPKALYDRPKMGFSVPIDAWLRGPLREWAETLLRSNVALDTEQWLRRDVVDRKWHEHLSGKWNWQYYLWNVLSLMSWLEHHRKEVHRVA